MVLCWCPPIGCLDGFSLHLRAIVAVGVGNMVVFKRSTNFASSRSSMPLQLEAPNRSDALVHIVNHVRGRKVERVNGVALADDLGETPLVVFQRYDGETRIIPAVVNLCFADLRLALDQRL